MRTDLMIKNSPEQLMKQKKPSKIMSFENV